MKHSVLIEGHKKAYGTQAPSWWEGELVDGLGKRPMTGQKIDALGGIAEHQGVTFDIIDTDYSLTDTIKFIDENKISITSPSPLLYDDTTLTASSTTHPVKKALSFPASGDMRVYPDPAVFDFGSIDFTWEYRFKLENTGLTQYFGRKLGQVGLAFSAASNTLGFVGGSTGTSVYLHTTNSMSTLGWYHVGIVYTAATDTVTLYVDNVGVSHVTTGTPGPLPAVAWEQWGVTSSTALALRGDIAQMRIWKRALSTDEWAAAYAGKPVDDTSLIFSSDISPYYGPVMLDISGNQRHLEIPSGVSFVSRDFLGGDLLHMPRDTARVVSVSGSDITVERQVHSCLEDGYCAYYQQGPVNEYVCTAHTEGPHQWEGRLMAYYVEDELRYLGYINSMAQRGKSWAMQTKHILEPLRDGIKYNHTVPLYYSGSYTWWVGYLWLNPNISGGTTLVNDVQALLSRGLLSYEATRTTAGAQWTDAEGFDSGNGYKFKRSDNPVIEKSTYGEGLIDVFFDDEGGELQYLDADTVCSTNSGVKKYGLIFSDGMGIKTLTDNPASFVGSYLKIRDGAYIYAESYSAITGKITFTGVYNEDLVRQSTRTCGISSNNPIVLEVAPIATAPNLVSLIYSILTSTGSGTNGNYDTLTGLFGMGLPSSIVNTMLTQADAVMPLQCDLSEGSFVDDLQANGLGLVFRDGQFKIQRMDRPVASLAATTIRSTDCLAGERTNLNYGYFHPLKSITYKGYEYDPEADALIPYSIKIGVDNSNIFFGSTGREKTWNSVTRSVITAESFRTRILQVLEWFNNYAPTVNITVPGHSVGIGDTVALSLSDMAGQGDYTVTTVPGIVVGVADDYQLTIVLNTADTTLSGSWVPSWEVQSYSGATLTLRKGGALSVSNGGTAALGVEGLIALPASMVLMRSDGTTIGSVTVLSVTDDNTIVLSAAPTYDQNIYRGILTFQDYTASSVTHLIDKFVWAANSSGIMSNSDSGKDLS